MKNNNNNSDFLYEDDIFQKIEKLPYTGETSEYYRVQINGEMFFMKRLRPEYTNDPKYLTIIKKEYQIGKILESRYTPLYISFGNTPKGAYILMEYINGVSIEEKLKSNPQYFCSKKNIYKLTMQLLQCLKMMHTREILHLDITPNNILLTNVGNELKIVDFGFCLSNSYIHTAGTTPKFAAPELLERRIDAINNSSDIYAVGALLQYIEKKTGKKLPAKLQTIMKRCLQHQQEKRYATVDDIIRIIKNRRITTLGKIAGVAAIVAAIAVVMVKCGLCTNIDNYIGWQNERFPGRFEANGIFYNITDDDARTVEITFKGNNPDEYEYEYEGGEVNIPQSVTYNGRKFAVTAIAGQAFKNPYISKVNIPEGIKVIKDSAMFGCLLNGVIRIPKSVEYFGLSNIFPSLYIDSIVVHKDNPYYDSRNNCNAIIETATNTLIAGCKNSVIPYGIEHIAKNAFIGAEELKHITIPATVKSIGAEAFVKNRISEIEIPEGITTLERYTFQYCENMQKVTLPQSLTTIKLAALSHCGFSEVVIPDSVTFIGDYAFDYCEYLKSVTIGRGVREIGYYVFDGCRMLEKVISHIPGDSLFIIDHSVFSNIGKDCVLYVPKGSKDVYKKTKGWNLFNKIEEM